MIGLLLASVICVTHPPGWSDPVISIETPDPDDHKKDLVVTDGNHVHQVWTDLNLAQRVGYNIVLPDGTVLLPDTLFSRDVWSANPSASYAPDSGFIGFWREGGPKWYSVRDHDGNMVVPPTLYSTEGWYDWSRIDSSLDSLGRVHMVWDCDPEVCYSILDPGVGEVFRDTIPDSWEISSVLVDGDRVHITFNGADQWADYIQYDLDGNVTVGPVDLIDGDIDRTMYLSMSTDSSGNALVFVERLAAGLGMDLLLYKIERDTGVKLIDGLLLYDLPSGETAADLFILSTPGKGSFYLVWKEEDTETGWPRLIRFAVIDTEGSFIEEPYTAYDYTDEWPQQIMRVMATTNQAGDVFINWSAYFDGIGFYIVLGWFDHNWLGVEEETEPAPRSDFTLSASRNPFTEWVTFTADADPLPGQLMVYDITGRLIRSLGDGQGGNTFLWDGRDASGNEVPPGTYLIQGASAGQLASVRVVKL